MNENFQALQATRNEMRKAMFTHTCPSCQGNCKTTVKSENGWITITCSSCPYFNSIRADLWHPKKWEDYKKSQVGKK